MATAARAIQFEPRRFQTPAIRCGGEQLAPAQVPVPKQTKNAKIVLQPRLCTLRSYGSDDVMKMIRKDGGAVQAGVEAQSFFATLSNYIDSTKKSQDFEIVSGRLAMVVFAATVTMEVVTGNSLFGKVETKGIAEAAGICLAAVACAAATAYISSTARTRVGRIFSLGCNSFIDSLIDQIVDGLFYETELSDWSDDV